MIQTNKFYGKDLPETMYKEYIVYKLPLFNKAGVVSEVAGSFEKIDDAIYFAAVCGLGTNILYDILDRSSWRLVSKLSEDRDK